MTACVNKHTKRVAAVVTASLVGALSLGAAAVPAFAEGVETLAVDETATPEDVWNGVEFEWSVDKDEYGEYTITAGDDFSLKGAKNPDGTTFSMADLEVYYYDASGNKVADFKDVSNYTAVVVNGKVNWWLAFQSGNLTSFTNALDGAHIQYRTVSFRAVAKTFGEAFAYQGSDITDTDFMFTGYPVYGDPDESNNAHFADEDGNELAEGTDYTVTSVQKRENLGVNAEAEWSPVSGAITNPGTYLVKIEGKGAYAGSSASIQFTVDKIDLAKAEVTIEPVQAAEANTGAIQNGILVQSGAAGKIDRGIHINGELVKPGLVGVRVVSGDKLEDGEWKPMGTPESFKGDLRADVDVEVYPYAFDGTDPSIEDCFVSADSFTTANLKVVGEKIDEFYYDGESISGSIRFETAKGEAFDPDLVKAYNNAGNEVARSVKVYKDGEEVSDWSEPGTYTVVVDVKTDKRTYEYAGTKTFQIVVVSKRYSEEPKVYVSVNGKDVSAPVEYDGEAVTPKVVAKVGSTVLTEGEDYTVTYVDKDGNSVEEIVEPGEYTATVDFGNAYYMVKNKVEPVKDVVFTVTVTKAEVETAKADQDLYAYTGEAVAPTFTAYTGAFYKGLSVAIDPVADGATYYEVVCGKDGKPVDPASYFGFDVKVDVDGDGIADYVVDSDPMTGSELTETGWYVAELVVPSDDPHFQGTVLTAPFEVSSYAVFSDVDADAWYAQDVYKAAQLGYMTGISGTDLFMPEAEISRAELAKVFANMAGHVDEGLKNPTQFDDVDPVAWYAEPIAWASEAGIVTGYDDTTFGPMDKASREQVATMLYRYAKNQGKDVSVSDVDGALSAYKDGDQVSDWARTAMAWAVENGIFGQGTDELWANQNIKRDAVATIAVRFQPEALPEA